MQSCPVLYPSQEEFKDFYRYVHWLDQKYKNTHGMVKIVPPSGWAPQSKNYHQKLENLVVKNPIEQNVQGSGGYYESKNIVQNKMTLKAYRKYADSESGKVEGKDNNQKQKIFWKTITYSPPIYGADLTGTLMDENAQGWNFNCLDSLLRYALTEKVKGVTEPYCYIGSWKAFFSWHKQDLDLSAINYIHEGASKIWYSIAKPDCHILEEQARMHFKQQSRKCSQFLRHKTFLTNPQLLLKRHQQIKISRVEHKAGEIMIVFGGVYHCGFNCGFNIAEAVNYATIDWLKELTQVQFCTCFKKSVKGEIESILYNIENSAIYEELAKSEQFQALQNFVLDMQLRQDNNVLDCEHQCENQNKQMQAIKNINTISEMSPVLQTVQKKEVLDQVEKEKGSKKIKKDKLKKKKKNQEEQVPSSRYKVVKSKQPRQSSVDIGADLLQDCKKATPSQQVVKAVLDDHQLYVQ